MEIKSRNAVVFTDKMFEELAEAYESGEWPGKATGEIVTGRPRLAVEDLKTVTFKLPVSKVIALDRFVQQHGGTRSEAIRQAVDGFLLSK